MANHSGSPSRFVGSSALLDGLREFPLDEVMLALGSDRGWGEAGALGERVEAGAGLPVTVVGPAGAKSQAA